MRQERQLPGAFLRRPIVDGAVTQRDPARTRLDIARDKLQQAGFTLTANLHSGDPEKVIADYIEQNQISLLMMGAYGHSRAREFLFGGVTRSMFKDSPIPLVVAH